MLTGIPLATYGLGLDVFHAPAYTAPLAGTPPVVLTVHDVSYARRPGDYPYKLDPIRQWFYRASARHAAAIVTDSAFSASEIEAAYEIRRDQIAVVPLAADQRFCPGEAWAAAAGTRRHALRAARRRSPCAPQARSSARGDPAGSRAASITAAARDRLHRPRPRRRSRSGRSGRSRRSTGRRTAARRSKR